MIDGISNDCGPERGRSAQRRRLGVLACLFLGAGACNGGDDASAPSRDGGPPTVETAFPNTPGFGESADGSTVADSGSCGATAPESTGAKLAPAFAGSYKAYSLGTLPGIPPSRLGGTVLSPSDPDLLLVAIHSEEPAGAIAQVRVKRNACGHIIGFDGNASIFSTTPYVDANLLVGPNNVLFYSEWPVHKLSQIPLSLGTAPTTTIDLSTVGVSGRGPGGIGFVPPNLADPGGLRAVTYPEGYWYHLSYAPSGSTFAITQATQTATLPNGPGGFAYVPQGSPGFKKQSIIMPEWPEGDVVVYEADNQGDPIVGTRTNFLTLSAAWGAYFEPKTGDFIFLTWGLGTDAIHIVQGFVKPPAPPAPK